MSELTPYRLPMFPLGTVLVPSAVLPLHVFEPRYRALVEDLRGSDTPEFGVVLIERGHEVGGGDVRTDVGTVARLLQAEPFGDGRWAIASVGVRRIEVLEWMADDPYPQALVVDWPDEDDPADAPPDDSGARYREVVALLRQALAAAAELGESVPPVDAELTDEPALGSFQVVALAPIGPIDRQALLAVPDARTRLDRLTTVLAETVELLRARIAMDGDGPATG